MLGPVRVVYSLLSLWIGLFSLSIMVNCGGSHSSQHPDENFSLGRGVHTMDDYENYMSGLSNDPRFRQARVTTQVHPLRLKTKADPNAPSPSTGTQELAKGSDVTVFWPLDLANDHIKVYVDGKALWVTYKSYSGKPLVTLLEDIYMPKVSAQGSGVIGGRGGPVNSGALGIVPVSLSSEALREAYTAIEEFNLQAADVASCDFNPMVGNNTGGNNCYRKIVVSSDFQNFVSNYGDNCARLSGERTFGQAPSGVLFHSAGAGQVSFDRKVSGSSKHSTHATGQAFDLYAITLYFPDHTTRKVTLSQQAVAGSSKSAKENHQFYWNFATCWRENVKQQADCSCGGEKVGALTYLDNSAHESHLHLSLPYCEKSAYNVACI